MSISGPTSASALQRRLEVLQILHQVGLRVVDQTGDGLAERAQLLQCRREPRPLPEQDVQGRRDLVQSPGEYFLLAAEPSREPVQLVDGRDDVVALLIQRARRRCRVG